MENYMSDQNKLYLSIFLLMLTSFAFGVGMWRMDGRVKDLERQVEILKINESVAFNTP